MPLLLVFPIAGLYFGESSVAGKECQRVRLSRRQFTDSRYWVRVLRRKQVGRANSTIDHSHL